VNLKLCFLLLSTLFILPMVFARESVNISTTSDLLELNESIGDVRETITEVELTRTLGGGIIITNSGSTEFNQYLRFKELNTTINTLPYAPRVMFKENDAPVKEVGDWMHVQEGSGTNHAFFEYELEFEDGLASIVVNNTLVDYTDTVLAILGRNYTILKARKQGLAISLDTLGSFVSGVMNERETRPFTLGNMRFDVQLIAVQPSNTASFRINSELTPPLGNGDIYGIVTPQGMPVYIGVTNIAYSPTGNGVAKVYLARSRLELRDTNYRDGEADPNLGFYNYVKVDGETIEDGWVQIKGELSNFSEVKLWSLKYRLLADALPGSRDIYAPPGHTIREYLDEPQGMIGGNWNIKYNGLYNTGVSIIKLDPAGDDKYNLEFENILGDVYRFPFISNENGVFKFGDDNDDLIMVEGNFAANMPLNQQAFNIGLLDYFILSDSGDTYDDTATSHIIRYNSLDTSQRQIQFDDGATGSRRFIYETTNISGAIGVAEIVFGGNTYTTYIANASTSGPYGGNDNPLAIDQNKDGAIGRDRIRITVNGGGIIDPIVLIGGRDIGRNINVTDGGHIFDVPNQGPTWTNTGNRIVSIPYGTNVTMSLITLSEDFDENLPSSLQNQNLPPTNGIANWTIVTRPYNLIGISPSSFNSNEGLVLNQPDENDDNYYGMTDYGVYFNLFDPEGTNNAETLTIEYPLQQRGANVEVIGTNQPPILNFIGDRRISIGQTLAIQMNATDPEEDPLTYSTNAASVIRSPFFFDNQTGFFRWQPQRSDIGNYQVTFTVSDGLETTSETIRISVPSQPTMSVIGAPVIGNTVSLFLSDQFSANQFYILAMGLSNTTGFPLGDGRSFPLDFDELFVASLYYPQALGLRESAGILNPLGNAVAQWAIPNMQELNGTTVHMAFLTIDPNRPLPEAILAISNAYPITLR